MYERTLAVADVQFDDFATFEKEFLSDVPELDLGFGTFDTGLTISST